MQAREKARLAPHPRIQVSPGSSPERPGGVVRRSPSPSGAKGGGLGPQKDVPRLFLEQVSVPEGQPWGPPSPQERRSAPAMFPGSLERVAAGRVQSIIPRGSEGAEDLGARDRIPGQERAGTQAMPGYPGGGRGERTEGLGSPGHTEGPSQSSGRRLLLGRALDGMGACGDQSGRTSTPGSQRYGAGASTPQVPRGQALGPGAIPGEDAEEGASTARQSQSGQARDGMGAVDSTGFVHPGLR